jgi:DNA-binding MarR family transcriptional regulator
VVVYHDAVATRRQGNDFGILLGLAYQAFVVELREELQRVGLDAQGRADGYVFRALDGQPLTVSDLAARLGVTKQAAGQIVTDMEQRGLVSRRPDPADGRARLLELTTEGRRALRAARAFHRRFEARLARELGADAVATVVRALEHVGLAEGRGEPRIRAHYL